MIILAAIKDLTGWRDQDLADMAGLSRVTVNRVLKGHVPENLPPAGRAALRKILVEYIAELDDVVAYMDMTS